MSDESNAREQDEPLQCIDGPDDCAGAVALRWPGYGHRHWPRCEKHAEERVEREDTARERYPEHAPSDFDPAYAGERWDADY